MEYEDPDAHSKLAVYAEWDKQRGQIQSQIFQGKLTNDDMKAWEKDNPNPGKPKSTTRHAESYKAEMEPMANEWVKEHLGQEVAGIHGQRLQEGDKTREALHRALAGFPEGKHAFAKPGEVDAEGAKAIRTFFEERIGGKAKVGAREAHDKEMQAWLDKNKAPEMYAKPEASLFSMFDEPPDPNAAPQISQEYKAWVGKRSQMAEMLREKHFGKQNITWPEYVAMMRGTDRARKAVQDRMKHELLTAFKGHYQDQHQAALMSSRDKIHASDRHLVALDPDAHKELRAQESKIDAGLHARDEFGKFIEDEIIARRIKKQAAARAEKDQTADPFGGTMDAEAEAKAQKEILPTERLTLGRQAEGQIAGMLQQMGHAYSPGKPLDVFPFRMHSTPEDLAPGGTPYHLQQRGIKFGVLRKRCGIHADVGSGKTNMAFGIFTSGHAKGEIKRAIFAVPSVVKGQFGQEAATYLEPGKYKVHADVKGDATGRFKAYRDSGTHMMVVTHQGFRDDAVKMLANHWRISPQQAAEQCMGTEPKELSGHLRAAFKEAGAEDLLDGFFMDEGHHSLNREGKQDSLFARIVDSISHHAEEKDKYFVNFTGTPVKNDMSEIHDELRKVAPSKYGDRGEFMRRFHGLTRANAAALQKEMDQHFYSFRIPAGTEPNRVVYGETPGKPALALTTEQKANVKAIEGHYEAATRAARQG
ncbi:MAG: DEAD/DEAH box helicase family protein, partial [Alphaproteobacteria bacterium]|nr:DEAD/DEAH box helicase family protein [Alphaproteobacteria bacterium]